MNEPRLRQGWLPRRIATPHACPIAPRQDWNFDERQYANWSARSTAPSSSSSVPAGAWTARALWRLPAAREGAHVVVADIAVAAGEETAHLAGHGAIAIRTDVTDEASLQAAIRTTVDTFGRLDVLHNNAGGSTPQDNTVVDAPIEEFWRVIRLDLFGTFLGCRHGCGFRRS